MLKSLITKEKSKKEFRKLIFELLAIAVVIVLLLKVFFGLAIINGKSMQPYLKDRGGVVFCRLAKEYQEGDIIIFPFDDELLVKRVIGVAGDVIDIDDSTGTVLINGKEEEDVGVGSTYSMTEIGGITFPITVGEGQVFVLGDNREDSMDSRWFGLVSTKDIDGYVIFQWSAV
jgi:signal peptidase I